MGLNINTKPFDLNKFWEKTPTPLKYLLLIAIIVSSSYFLYARKLNIEQIKELDKVEEGIATTYQLIDKFEAFQNFQMQYNDQIIKDIKNIYILITELNDNVNKKFDNILNTTLKGNKDLIDKMILLNESFDKLSKVYKPEILEKNNEQQTYPKDINIMVKPIKK